ncbi:bifunctional UDP-N-acetylglucosamine diphosphorylase/glucosamine-1-phosphate N-acetyltransferase GlmU [Neoroseomonas oryzicola]|uniref:Bifunctional protein GlmU n=1 Tax=Neoroseomonas oryzicola TaxID=535904 RepID=A0A9X9WBR8_9PROT|nr:bifunctional UDP-N-acetylglucosamine diphosphorylase/glucosamine-1-phosphate N-acetyltransferase GlmU [Neoroseomonas oryzicola]MBR0657778.1 bifunctional UDP-N-acetylglucosamine diphosphorylase/glucosamine-1-phosphate N-acetyltransferase GlmU [Neoroseomonas oryzicola]NKE18654.1 bifunctional UDP-N-acetylglucosamine diphosphorylase/glucosamine-1-phosphate N-acetyltransferase GlmU [Neoroseomonas oryzicola]
MTHAAVILAAGLGTRMRSPRPKVMHPIAGRPMIRHLLQSVEARFGRVVVVVGPDMPELEAAVAPHAVAVQRERLGTAHAALQAGPQLGGHDGDVAILYGDNPLISEATLARLQAARSEADLVLLAMRPADPGRYGRVVTRADGMVERVVEWADASADERAIGLCNAGVVCARGPDLFRWLAAVRNDNAKGEYYLTDVVALARAEGRSVRAVEAPEAELRGINSKAELAGAEAEVQAALRAAALDAGVTMIAPETVFLSWDTRLGADTVIEPNVFFGPGVTVEEGALIHSFSHLTQCIVRRHAEIGPFARLRPGAVIEPRAHVGNFVELKATTLGEGAKANHLSYLGDATIGAGANIGAGTITCNYDGVKKHRTEIGEGAFIGSDTSLVAPVKVGARALIGAGSVITTNVPDDALAIARGRQAVFEGRGFKGKKGK